MRRPQEKVATNRVALVTGGATRLGAGFSKALAAEGWQVAIHYNSSQEKAEALVTELQEQGCRALLFQADLQVPSAPKNLATKVIEAYGQLDLLLNNASSWSSHDTLHAPHGLLQETLEEWERNMAVNCRAPFFLMQAFAPALKKTRGSVINILDQSVSFPYLERSSHSVSKSGLKAASRIAAQTLAPDVRVNCLEFGAILPPDQMPLEEVNRWTWEGLESAVQAMLFVLNTPGVNGEIIPVRGSTHLKKQL